MPVGEKLGNIINFHICILISIIIQYSAFAILFFFYEKYYIVFISIGLFNIGNAICILTTIKNCWKYFPKSYGFINGFILSGAGLCSSLLTFLGEYIFFNPDKKEIYEEESYKKFLDNYDNFKDNLQLFFYIIIGILVISGIFGLLFNCGYKGDISNIDLLIKKENVDENENENENENESDFGSFSDYNFNNRGSLKIQSKRININNALCSCHNLKLICFGALGLCKINLLINFKYYSFGPFNINLL